jgi:pilus assembly protein CpaC
VLAGNRINLVVNPEVSQLSSAGALASGGFSIPSLTTRRAETTVELGSGQSFAIAGLLQNDLSHDINKLPGLGDIPILGRLFQSDNYKRNESELVIVVTPYIVRPVNSPRMALPNDGFRAPTDFERLVKGELYPSRPLLDAPAPSGQDGKALVGPAGFILN